MKYELHVSRTTVHISTSEFTGDPESGNHFGALTRGLIAVLPGKYETAADALKAAQIDRRKVCKICEKAVKEKP